MASISGFGISCSGLMLALATSPSSAATESPAARGSATIDVTIRGLRSNRGVVKLVLCPAGAPFPQCGARGVPATLTIRDRMASATLTGIVPGTYAIAVFHDANGNGRLDTFLGIPREAFGFSNNPPVRPRAPRFAECSFVVSGKIAEFIDMKSVF